MASTAKRLARDSLDTWSRRSFNSASMGPATAEIAASSPTTTAARSSARRSFISMNVSPYTTLFPTCNVRGLCYSGGMAHKTQTLTIRLGPRLREDLERAAARSEMTLGEFVRHVLLDYLKHNQTEGGGSG